MSQRETARSVLRLDATRPLAQLAIERHESTHRDNGAPLLTEEPAADSGARRVQPAASAVGEAFDRVVIEEPLEIRVRGEPIAVTMRTPGDDEELAIGFLVTEGVLRSPREVRGVSRPEANAIDVDSDIDAGAAKRALYSASSCGLCGKGTITAITVRVPRVEQRTQFSHAALLAMPDRMRAAQPTFDRTGGLHAAALFDADGKLVALREDIGRHNATDKVIGRAFLDGDLAGKALLVSGRVGFEIVQKAAVAHVELVAAISAPSSLAIDLADRLGMTLVAFLRPPRASLYTHPSRLGTLIEDQQRA